MVSHFRNAIRAPFTNLIHSANLPYFLEKMDFAVILPRRQTVDFSLFSAFFKIDCVDYKLVTTKTSP
jgi:hypothetical protein